MQIRGKIGKSGLGFVSAYLIANNTINAAVRFYIDTGASHTTIADRDARRIGIDYTKLAKAPFQISGVGGLVDAYLLPECMVLFNFENSALAEYLNTILVLKHDPKTPEEERNVLEVPSLMGLDILKKYTVRFTNSSVILER